MQQLAKTVIEGEVYTHRLLWKAALAMRERADESPDGAQHFHMGAMLIARLTVEAYCNFLIHVLDEALFHRERETFRSSTASKIDWLIRRLSVTIPSGRRPLQTISELHALRDRIVHAKPEVYADEIEHPADEDPPFLKKSELTERISQDKCNRAIQDVEIFCEALHRAARATAETTQQPRLGPYALQGTLQQETGSTSWA